MCWSIGQWRRTSAAMMIYSIVRVGITFDATGMSDSSLWTARSLDLNRLVRRPLKRAA
jgi:hypothetical protein